MSNPEVFASPRIKPVAERFEARSDEVVDDLQDAIMDSIKTKPYTTLAVVAAIGFVAGAIWKGRS